MHGSKPARTATVELHNASGDVVDQVQTDDDGRFTYHLVAGEWSVRVWDEHGHRGRAEFELSDEDHELNLDLEEPEGGH
jgi:hypothetical protein